MNCIKDVTIFEVEFSKVENKPQSIIDKNAFVAAKDLRQLQTIIDEIKGDLYIRKILYTKNKLLDPCDYYYDDELLKIVNLAIVDNSYTKTRNSFVASAKKDIITLIRNEKVVKDIISIINREEEIFVYEAVVSEHSLYTINNLENSWPLWLEKEKDK